MARTLYRIYLYAVWLFLMVFVTIAIGVVLGTLLMATPLNGSSQFSPTQISVTQEIIFALLAVVIAAPLAGLHYWLIRRDIRDDPAAASGPVRALFLNGVEAISILVGVPTIAFALASLANFGAGGIAAAIATGAVAFGLFTLLETERRHSSVAPGAAIALQRLHFYGMQLILLFIATGFWLNAMSTTINVIAVNAGLLPNGCAPILSPNAYCYNPPFYGEPLPNLVWLWAGAAFVTLALVGYGYIVRHDNRSALRLVLHFAAYAYGLIFMVAAVYLAASLALSFIQNQTVTASDFLFRYQFIAPAVFGVLVVAVFASWLARDALRGYVSAHTIGLTALAVTTAVLAVPFWIGCATVAYTLLTANSPATAPISPDQWTSAIALLFAGLGYVPLSLRMRVLARRYTPATPRRGLVFALLGAGTLTAAIGLIVTLYAVLTNALGAPVDNWQTVARAGVIALATGAVIVAIYFSRAQVEGWFRRAAPPAPSVAAAPSALSTSPVSSVSTEDTTGAPTLPSAAPSGQAIEGVLDALLAGTLTRDEAAGRLRALLAPGA